MTMAWMRRKKKAMAMTWKGSKRGVCGAWCVCALLCCVASGSTEDRGTGGVGSEGQKSAQYTGKYENLRPLNAANTRGKYQKGFMRLHVNGRLGWLISTQGGFSSNFQ